jgi:hypothetical protein
VAVITCFEHADADAVSVTGDVVVIPLTGLVTVTAAKRGSVGTSRDATRKILPNEDMGYLLFF